MEQDPQKEVKVFAIRKAIAEINAIELGMQAELWKITSLDTFSSYCQEHADEDLHILAMQFLGELWGDEWKWLFNEFTSEDIEVFNNRIVLHNGIYRAEIPIPRWLYDLSEACNHVDEYKFPEEGRTWGSLLKLLQDTYNRD